MSSALQWLLRSAPPDVHGAPAWIEPDDVLIDDLHGPAALKLFADTFGAHTSLARPERVRVVSAIDLDNALPDRVQAHEALMAFAAHHRLTFEHASGACEQGCPLPVDAGRERVIATSRKPSPSSAAAGSISIKSQAQDLAGLLATGRMWVQRPPLQYIRISGALPALVTVHDLAIALRPRIVRDGWTCLEWINGSNESMMRTLCALLLNDSPAQAIFAGAAAGESAATGVQFDPLKLTPLLGEGGRIFAPSEIEPTDVDRVYIGSCTTGSVADLRLAAEVLAGRRVHVPTVIAPASMADVELLRREQLGPSGPSLETVFREAGCDLGLPGCASCVNALGDLNRPAARDEPLTVVATAVASVSARRVARVLTASPITAAQVAVRGRLN